MNAAAPASGLAAAKSLWKRAPWWRFTLLSCALLVFLTVLFPPHLAWYSSSTAPVSLSAASYQAPAEREQAAPTPTATPTPPPSPRAAAPAPVRVAAQVKPPPMPAAVAPTPPPAAATAVTLSLATPANQSTGAGSSGIDAAMMGRTYQHELLMNGFKLPLPPGEWVALASSSVHVIKHPENTGMNYFLGQIEHARLVSAITVLALRNSAAPETGFEGFLACDNPENIYSSKEEITPFGHQACWIVQSFFTPPLQQWADKAAKLSNLYRAAAGDMAAKGVTYPQDFVAVQFFRAETWGLLDAMYLSSPEKERIDSNVVPSLRDSDWFGPHLQKYPDKVAYTEKLKKWGEQFWPRFKAAYEAGR